MKRILFLLAIISISATAQKSSMKAVLLEQLKSTHNASNWFVSLNVAVEGLSSEKAAWKDGGNHSVGQLAYHILFWNERVLQDLKGEKKASFSGKNDETFENFDQAQWNDVVKKLDLVLTGIENWVENATDDQLKKNASTIANVSAHNAYHTGQIIVVRKAQGSWDPEKGVK